VVEDNDDHNDKDYVDGDEGNNVEENITEGAEVSDAADDSKKKRPISLAENENKKRTKTHPALELMTTLSSAVEKAVSERAQAKSKELQVRSKELEAAAQKAEGETKLKVTECTYRRGDVA
jgi:hypothetical protein